MDKTIWNVYYRNVLLGYFDESKFERREQYQPCLTAKTEFKPNLSVNYLHYNTVRKMKGNLVLRTIRSTDCKKISQSFQEQGWDKPISQYEKYIELQQKGERDVIIAELNQEFAGYLTIKWKSDYIPFRTQNIPEIVDFNVLKKYQRLGIGTSLMDEAEKRIKKISEYAGIGFGIYKDYGAAQILYINRGYKPDGNGLVKNSIPLKYGEIITVDDSVVFCLTKKLQENG